jgi:hypothetical protein
MDKHNRKQAQVVVEVPLVKVEDVRSRYDPELPNASAVLAALSCVSAQYAKRPYADLAILASDLAYQLQAPEYAESQLISDVAKQLAWQWDEIVDRHNDALLHTSERDMACH